MVKYYSTYKDSFGVVHHTVTTYNAYSGLLSDSRDWMA